MDRDLMVLLSLSNGTSFNGLRLYGAAIEANDELGRFDFVQTNLLTERRGEDILYGEWQGEFLVHVRQTGRLERRSKSTWTARESYESYGALLVVVLSEACALVGHDPE